MLHDRRNGNLLLSMNIDFSTAAEQMPDATYIPTGINKWLIPYERNGSGGSNDLVLAALVDVTGAVTTRSTIYSSPNLEINPQAAYSISTQRVMFAWTQGNDSLVFVFARRSTRPRCTCTSTSRSSTSRTPRAWASHSSKRSRSSTPGAACACSRSTAAARRSGA